MYKLITRKEETRFTSLHVRSNLKINSQKKKNLVESSPNFDGYDSIKKCDKCEHLNWELVI